MEDSADMINKRTVVGEDANLTGRIVGQDITLLGSFEGRIEATGKIHAAERSRVKARLVAREVLVAGEFEGEVEAYRLCFGPQARARGRFAADCLTIADGANVEGSFNLDVVVPADEIEPAGESTRGEAVSDVGRERVSVGEFAEAVMVAG